MANRTRTQKVDVRVVAATHRNLEELTIEKQFRSDGGRSRFFQ
jgi:transcriptional regulator with GAF, ATPase, and Fis domain